MTYLPNKKSEISTGNSSTSTLTNGSTFTGTGELNDFPDVLVQVTTDQDGTFYIEFSPDGTNWDTSLSFEHDASRINPPHVFVKAERYFRVRFVNDSGSDQTYFRLITIYGTYDKLTSPINGTLSENYDATATRPTDYRLEVAIGKRQGRSNVHKFGYNEDIDTGGEEIIASFGGIWGASQIITTAQTFTVTYDNSTDGSGGSATGATQLFFTYIDENFHEQQGVHVLGSTGSDTTSFSGVGINRVVVLASGTAKTNVNNITITATTLGSNQAMIPAGTSVTQQLIYHTQIGHSLPIEHLDFTILKTSGGATPRVTLRMYSYSRVTDTVYNVLEKDIDTNVQNDVVLNFPNPLVFTGREVIYLTAETSVNNTKVAGRFSGIETRTSNS